MTGIPDKQRCSIGTGNCRAEFTMKISHAHLVDELGVVINGIRTDPICRGTSVVDEIGVKPEVPCHSSRGLDTKVGEEPGDDQPVDAPPPEANFKRSPDERTINILAHNKVVSHRFKSWFLGTRRQGKLEWRSRFA